MKKTSIVLLVVLLIVALAGCKAEELPSTDQLEVVQMQEICELATMKCYYHNVVKVFEEDAGNGFLGIGKKDKRFWMEYEGEVILSVNAELIDMNIKDDVVSITIPPAQPMEARVSKIEDDAYIVDKRSAKVTAEDQTKAHRMAKEQLEEQAKNDTATLELAQKRAMTLMEDYVRNIGDLLGRKYTIKWIFVDANGDPTGDTAVVDMTTSTTTVAN